jgi:hypothetical protein
MLIEINGTGTKAAVANFKVVLKPIDITTETSVRRGRVPAKARRW